MIKTPARETSIRRRINLSAATLLLPVILLAAGLVVHQWQAYAAAEAATRAFEQFRATLQAMEKVSAERGPTNGALGADAKAAVAARSRMMSARAESDRRIANLLAQLDPHECNDCAAARESVETARARLASARKEVDAVVDLPKERRDQLAISNAVRQMIDVIPWVGSSVISSASAVVRGDPDAVNCLGIARLSADLREQAGQLGSGFTTALSANRPLTSAELLALERTRGRIDALRELIGARVGNHPALITHAFENINTQYFGTGTAYLRGIQEAAMRPGGAGVSPAELAASYVPTMAAIIDYRDEVLSLAESDVLDHRDRARLLLGVVALAAMLLTGALLAAGTVFRRRFVQPFVEATTVIKEIAEGKFSTPVPQASNRDEILGLFSAIAVLKANSIAKLSLERERDVLIRDLEIMADTDSLTRMLNRRAFLRKAHIALREARVDGATPALIMFDIDHFKEINDTYGHAAGDHALQVLAKACRELCRPADTFARIGGEEFALFTYVNDVRSAVEIANRLRRRIAGTAVNADGLDIAMTASFGVAVPSLPSDPSSRTTVDELLKRADRFLYRAKRAGRNRVESELDALAD
jgi:diguanylate cyclase (GGDEF)-like protein